MKKLFLSLSLSLLVYASYAGGTEKRYGYYPGEKVDQKNAVFSANNDFNIGDLVLRKRSAESGGNYEVCQISGIRYLYNGYNLSGTQRGKLIGDLSQYKPGDELSIDQIFFSPYNKYEENELIAITKNDHDNYKNNKYFVGKVNKTYTVLAEQISNPQLQKKGYVQNLNAFDLGSLKTHVPPVPPKK